MSREKKVKEVFDSIDEFLDAADFDEDTREWIQKNWEKVKEATHIPRAVFDFEAASAVDTPNLDTEILFQESDGRTYIEKDLYFDESEDENIIYGELLNTDLGKDGLLFPEPVIEKFEKQLMEEIVEGGESSLYAVDENHKGVTTKGKIRSFMQLPGDLTVQKNGEKKVLEEGSLVVKANASEELAEKIEEGEIKGWSIEAMGDGFDPAEFAESVEISDLEEDEDDIDLVPPQAAQENAQRAREIKEETDTDCGTRVGWIRSAQIANGEELSEDVVARMSAFQRHRDDSERNEDVPIEEDCGYIMWKAWGGDEGIEWAERKVDQLEEQMDGKIIQDEDPCWSGYEQVGMKRDENGNLVPNCVPKENLDEKIEEIKEEQNIKDIKHNSISMSEEIEQKIEEIQETLENIEVEVDDETIEERFEIVEQKEEVVEFDSLKEAYTHFEEEINTNDLMGLVADHLEVDVAEVQDALGELDEGTHSDDEEDEEMEEGEGIEESVETEEVEESDEDYSVREKLEEV